MSDDDELYEKLINMWDKREYMIGLLSQNRSRPLHLEVKSNAEDLVAKIYNDTGGDKERTLQIFGKALGNYNKDAIHYGDIVSELEIFKLGNGKLSETR